jgi:hypothetical protein
LGAVPLSQPVRHAGRRGRDRARSRALAVDGRGRRPRTDRGHLDRARRRLERRDRLSAGLVPPSAANASASCPMRSRSRRA